MSTWSSTRATTAGRASGAVQAMIADGTYQAILERFGVGGLSIAN